MKTGAEAIAWVREQGIALQAAKVGKVPSLAHEIVGGPIKGSWWGHPKGKLIFALASAVDESGEVLSLKLIQGKTTYVHRTLWPALLRVLLDGGWREERLAGLTGRAHRMFTQVEDEGVVEGGEPKTLKLLDERLLVHAESHHTDEGHHEKTLTSWARWAKRQRVKPLKVSLDEAIATLTAAAHGATLF